MTFKISPGVYPKLVDLTERPRPFATSIGAAVFASARGSLLPQFISDKVRFRDQYGAPDPTISFGHDSCNAFLEESPMLWCLRVIGQGARWSGAVVVNNWLATDTYEGTSIHSLNGSDTDFDEDGRQITDLVFAGDLVTANTINMEVMGDAITPVTFTTSNNNTLRLVAQAIQTIMDGIASGGKVFVVDRVDTSQAAKQRIIRIIAPVDVEVDLASIVIASGASQTTAQQRDVDWLFKLYSENPGAWGNNLAVGLDTIDMGLSQKIRVTIDSALVASNVFNGKINGVTISPVTYATSSNATLQAIATAIATALGGGATAVVKEVSGNNNNRQIDITAGNANADMLLENFTITAGASQPLLSYAESRKRIEPDNSFNLKVYEGSLTTPVESYRVSLYDQRNGLGQQMNMAYQINKDARRSKRIRAVINPDIDGLMPLNTLTPNKVTKAGYLQGGDDGNAVTDQQIIQGWNQFADPEVVSIRILINCGYSTPEVQQKMDALCNKRRDCFAVLDMPTEMQQAQDCASYRNNELNIDSSYSAIYTPDVQIYDESSGKQRYIPPSGLVAAKYAYTDRVAHEWFAPAGLNRGLITVAMGLYVTYNEGDRDLLSLNQINTIRKMGPRFPIWGEYTLQYRTSDLSSVPVRRLVITIETSLVDAVATSVFEPNDPFTRRRVMQMCEDFLLPIRNGRGLYEFQVVCDESNNTPDLIDQRELHVDVYIKPVLAVLYLQLQTIITKTGADINEIAQTTGGNF